MTGDQERFFARLNARMPSGWFGSSSPLLDTLLMGIASAYSAVYGAYAYMRVQTRLQTSTDDWLDMAAADYFGTGGLPRLLNESDVAYRMRIQINIVRERGTRRAVESILTDLTGPHRPFWSRPSPRIRGRMEERWRLRMQVPTRSPRRPATTVHEPMCTCFQAA
ncbi:hypothetical protein BPMI_02404c [Candidatus Burkholderia pumila]|uniref:Uncharacterized protein n=1 Tax=Candidatus Burkholderia pumila TaxID=1090375 RepID=A0ABR5HLR6_9BURK|nr:hypothetical protein BPMI_02404c [Candidatus Burkholderia pumila]